MRFACARDALLYLSPCIPLRDGVPISAYGIPSCFHR